MLFHLLCAVCWDGGLAKGKAVFFCWVTAGDIFGVADVCGKEDEVGEGAGDIFGVGLGFGEGVGFAPNTLRSLGL
jgi:hypothetical protein